MRRSSKRPSGRWPETPPRRQRPTLPPPVPSRRRRQRPLGGHLALTLGAHFGRSLLALTLGAHFGRSLWALIRALRPTSRIAPGRHPAETSPFRKQCSDWASRSRSLLPPALPRFHLACR